MDAKINFNRIMPERKRSQVTIFIIFGLIFVVLILIIIVLRFPNNTPIVDDNTPQSFIESCTKDAIKEAIERVSENAGSLKPQISVMYKNINRTYLCYTSSNFKPCVNQQPKLIEHIETEINNSITPKIINCFNAMDSQLKNRYELETGDLSIVTKLEPRQVVVTVYKKMILKRGESTREFNSYKTVYTHPIFNLAEIANIIVNQETQFCNFDSLGYMILYPDYDITKFKTGNSDIIYNIKDRKTNEDFNFAIRTCILPPGH